MKNSTKLFLLLIILIIIVFLIGFSIIGNIIKEENELLKLDVNIHNKFKQISPGKEILAEIKLQFFGNLSELKDVYVIYVIKDLEENIIAEKSETFGFWTKASSIVEIYIPNDAKEGNYLLYVHVNYDGIETEATDSFEVVENQLEQAMPASNKIISILIIILLIILILIFYLINYKIKRLKNES